MGISKPFHYFRAGVVNNINFFFFFLTISVQQNSFASFSATESTILFVQAEKKGKNQNPNSKILFTVYCGAALKGKGLT